MQQINKQTTIMSQQELSQLIADHLQVKLESIKIDFIIGSKYMDGDYFAQYNTIDYLDRVEITLIK